MNDPHLPIFQDQVLYRLSQKYSLPDIHISEDPFADLASAIVSQQLSNKAADTIYNRFLILLPAKVVKPENILSLSDDQLRSVGLSRQKISYLQSLSQNVLSGQLAINTLFSLSDEEIINELTRVKGIGRWTAEMFLIFSLGRPDVFSVGDLGLRTAVSRLYNLERENQSAIKTLSEKWSPFRSYASRLLWKSLDNEPKVASTV